jgi:flagellin-specific chaperone FliS
MYGQSAYKQSQSFSKTRIDTIITLYRKALSYLDRARLALVDNRPEVAKPFLLNTQTIVMALASNLPAYKDEGAANFFRLYEFIAFQMGQGALENVDAAVRILRILLEGFEAKHDEALALELQGAIPALDADNGLSLTA